MHVLGVEPYFGGSHRSFLRGIEQHSRHDWTLITGTARHWKWRMRVSPMVMARELVERVDRQEITSETAPRAILCSEMLDLPQWRGFLSRPQLMQVSPGSQTCELLARIAALPAVVYFHENQWVYPLASGQREDAHYGYTNLLTALAADEVWFNSHYHQQVFFDASRQFVARMPDTRSAHPWNDLRTRCRVVPPGFEPMRADVAADAETCTERDEPRAQPLRIGWVARWEHDKRPDRFAELVDRLIASGINLELILLGGRPHRSTTPLERIEKKYAERILCSGFAESREEYSKWLRKIDVVVSTADHEFFGIAICEAISAGAIPLVPDALSYPELVDEPFRYCSLEDAVRRVEAWLKQSDWKTLQHAAGSRLPPLRLDRIAVQVDEGIERIAAKT